MTDVTWRTWCFSFFYGSELVRSKRKYHLEVNQSDMSLYDLVKSKGPLRVLRSYYLSSERTSIPCSWLQEREGSTDVVSIWTDESLLSTESQTIIDWSLLRSHTLLHVSWTFAIRHGAMKVNWDYAFSQSFSSDGSELLGDIRHLRVLRSDERLKSESAKFIFHTCETEKPVSQSTQTPNLLDPVTAGRRGVAHRLLSNRWTHNVWLAQPRRRQRRWRTRQTASESVDVPKTKNGSSHETWDLLCLGGWELPHEVHSLLTPPSSCLDAHNDKFTATGSSQLWVLGFLVSSGTDQRRVALRFPGTCQDTAQCNVHCELCTTKAWNILRQNLYASAVTGTTTFMSRRYASKRTRAPASRHTRASTRSVGVTRFFTRPPSVHAALWRPRTSRALWHPSQVASLQEQHTEQLGRDRVLFARRGMGEGGSRIATGMWSELFCVDSFVQSQRIQWPFEEAAMPNRAQRAANKVLRETKNAAKAKARDKRKTQRKTQETMDTVCGDEAGPKIWRTSLRGRPKKLAKISGGGKNSRLWASSSAKKVLLTAEKVGIGPKLAKISGGVKLGHLEEGGGSKMAKIHYGVKTSRK